MQKEYYAKYSHIFLYDRFYSISKIEEKNDTVQLRLDKIT